MTFFFSDRLLTHVRVVGVSVILFALCLTPIADAAGLRGEISFPDGASLRGPTQFAASSGALDVSAADPVIHFERAHGWFVTREWQLVGPPGPYQINTISSQPRNESWSRSAGEIRGLACAPALCQAILVADGEGTLSLSGTVDGPLRSRTTDDAYSVTFNATGPNNFYYALPAGWISAATGPRADATQIRNAEAFATGTLTFFLTNASVEVAADGRVDTIDTRPEQTSVADGPGGVFAAGTKLQRFLVLRLEGATLASATGEIQLTAPTPSVLVEGRLAAASAQGWIAVGRERVALDGQSLRVDGSLSITTSATPGATGLVAPLLTAQLGGDVRAAYVNGARIGAPLGVTTLSVAAISLLALLLVLAVALSQAPLTWLYSRIDSSRVLAHPKRRGIMEEIGQTPGVHASELARRLGIARVAAQHHLRLLAAHGMISSRVEGGRRAYFIAGSAPGAADTAARAALADETRRRVFDALTGTPTGATQAELVHTLGLSQRLVAYHLARLVAAGVVQTDGARPQRYIARERAEPAEGHAPASS